MQRTTLPLVSPCRDFARTFQPNANAGSDHAWVRTTLSLAVRSTAARCTAPSPRLRSPARTTLAPTVDGYRLQEACHTRLRWPRGLASPPTRWPQSFPTSGISRRRTSASSSAISKAETHPPPQKLRTGPATLVHPFAKKQLRREGVTNVRQSGNRWPGERTGWQCSARTAWRRSGRHAQPAGDEAAQFVITARIVPPQPAHCADVVQIAELAHTCGNKNLAPALRAC